MSTESGKTENQQEATISSLAFQMDSLFHLEDYLSVVDKATDIFELRKGFRWRNDIAVWEHFQV